jgi:hypothetical protein
MTSSVPGSGDRKRRTRKVKALGISVDLDETITHWLIWISPGAELAALGISPHRTRLGKCGCADHVVWASGRCKLCKGWGAVGVADYVIRLIRSYPKITVQVPAAKRQRRQRMPETLRWGGAAVGWVAG